jgi:hypothetical protein
LNRGGAALAAGASQAKRQDPGTCVHIACEHVTIHEQTGGTIDVHLGSACMNLGAEWCGVRGRHGHSRDRRPGLVPCFLSARLRFNWQP